MYLTYYALLRESLYAPAFNSMHAALWKTLWFFFWSLPCKLSLQPKWLLFKMKMEKKYKDENGKKSIMTRNFLPSNFIATINSLIFWNSWGVCWPSCLFISWREQCEKKNISSPFDWLYWWQEGSQTGTVTYFCKSRGHGFIKPSEYQVSKPQKIQFLKVLSDLFIFLSKTTLTVSCDTALLVGR